MAVIDATGLRAALIFASDRFQREESRLNALDGAIGDGDHGITVRMGFVAFLSTMNGLAPDAAIETVLRQAGRAFMNATGGAIGVIFGKALIAGGKTLGGCTEMGPEQLHALLEGMAAAVATTGKAKPGDKTLLDALHAAAQAPVKPELSESLRCAAAEAARAAAETAKMLCKVGRASRLGERAIGHQDPGAVSFSIFLDALAEWFDQNASKHLPEIKNA